MVEKTCPICLSIFHRKPSAADKSTYCSRDCMSIGYKDRLLSSSNPNFKNLQQRICNTCGIGYSSYVKTSNYCSRSCAAKRPSNIEKCKRMSFSLKPRSSKRGEYCRLFYLKCRNCRGAFVGKSKFRRFCVECSRYGSKIIRTCCVCGNQKRGHAKTCSSDCRSKLSSISQSGSKSHRWAGGKTSKSLIIRGSLEYKRWRDGVFLKSNFTCCMCLSRGGKLAAHHIKPFSTHPDLQTEPSNGISLCWPCHRSIKGKEGQLEAIFSEIEKMQRDQVPWHLKWAGQSAVAKSGQEAAEIVLEIERRRV